MLQDVALLVGATPATPRNPSITRAEGDPEKPIPTHGSTTTFAGKRNSKQTVVFTQKESLPKGIPKKNRTLTNPLPLVQNREPASHTPNQQP